MKNNSGFTLIEVLVALAIIGIAMTAIIKATSQSIRDTSYLQQKVMANWVATRVIHEVQAGVISVAKTDEVSEETDLLGQTWTWKATVEETPNSKIRELRVAVFHKDNENEITQLTGYLYAQN